jgi:hypothetical protein
MLGMYYWLDNYHPLGLALLGMGSNLLILGIATPGHLLTGSIVLTAVVIGTATLAIWALNWPHK